MLLDKNSMFMESDDVIRQIILKQIEQYGNALDRIVIT